MDLIILNEGIYQLIPVTSKILEGISLTSKNIEYQCIKSMAETEIYMGEKSIKKLHLE